MQRATLALAIGLTFSGAAVPQDLPPGVLLLSRVKRRVKQELQRLSNISCLETVQRERQPARGRMRPMDTVRLEVLSAGDKELFASPGDRKFSEQHPITYTGGGVMGDGFFALYLRMLVLNTNASLTYKGEEEIAGRRLARWDFRLPLMWSGQRIDLPEGSGNVGLHGAFWADPATTDVVRLQLNADDFPPTLPLSEAVWNIEYARTSLDDGSLVLLPQSGDFRMVTLAGEISHNTIEFTHCRAYGAQSAIRFDAPDAPAAIPSFGVASLDDTLRPLPAGLQIAVKLHSAIGADATVGSLIQGVVAANAPAKGAVVVPAGSPVRGRIRRLERYSEPVPHLVIALEFTEVELQGIRHRFYADLVSVDGAPGVEQTLIVEHELGPNRHATQTLSLPAIPGVAAFFFKGTNRDLPQGLRTVWKTRSLER